MSKSDFKSQHPFEKRKAEAKRILLKYPNRIPVISEKLPGSNIADIDKKKYLVPADLTVGQFIYVIRKRIELAQEEAIYVFVGKNHQVKTADLMSEIYKQYADEDGFLYIMYAAENMFG